MLTLSYELSHNVISTAEASRLFVLVKIVAPAIEEQKRVPLNLSLCIDTSGSMQGDKIKYACHASKFLVSQLSPVDIFSLVQFSDDPRVIVPAQHITNKDNIKYLIDRIVADGYTNLSGGWLLSSQELLKNIKREQVNRIILLTDGQANRGVIPHEQLVGIGRDLTSRDITTSTVGFGSDFNEDLLIRVAEGGRGNFHYINSPEIAPRIFSEELSELLALFAQNLILTIAPSSQVQYVRVHHEYPVRQTGKGEMQVEMGDIYSMDQKALLVEFVVPASMAGEKVGVSALTLTYQQIYGNLSFNEVSALVKVGYGHKEELESQKINPIVQREILLCSLASERKEAISIADSGNLKDAKKKLQDSIDRILGSDFSDEDLFKQEVKKLKGLLQNFDSREAYQSSGRKAAYYGSISLSKGKGIYSSARAGSYPLEAIEILKNAQSVVVITGQSFSEEIGVPGLEKGLPGKEKLAEILTYESFEKRPAEVWSYIEGIRELIAGLDPGDGFATVARMEDYWKEFQIITAAIDGMHKRAGNTNVLELFGNVFNARCIAENKVIEAHSLNRGGEEKCSCGSYLRPDIFLRGEKLSDDLYKKAISLVTAGKVILMLGVNFKEGWELMNMAKEKGAVVMEINKFDTSQFGVTNFNLGKETKVELPLLWKQVLM